MAKRSTDTPGNKWGIYLRQTLVTGLTFGFGLLIGNAGSLFILDWLPISFRDYSSEEAIILLGGILLALFIMGISNALVAGLPGGWTLPIVFPNRSRGRYAGSNALSVGLFYPPLVFLALFLISLFGFYYVIETPVQIFLLIFLLVGIIFGALFSLFLGVLTTGLKSLGWILLSAVIGFGFGGLVLGYGTWGYLISVVEGRLVSGELWLLLLGIFAFGALGGGALGFAYSVLALRYKQHETPPKRNWLAALGCAGVLIIFLLGVGFFRKLVAVVQDFVISRDAGLSSIIEPKTIGPHWSEAIKLASQDLEADQVSAIDLDVSRYGEIGMVWSTTPDPSRLYYQPGRWDALSGATVMDQPLLIPGDYRAASPASVVMDKQGNAHILWRAAEQIYYVTCRATGCLDPVTFPSTSNLECVSGEQAQITDDNLAASQPVIAVSDDRELMAVWLDRSGSLVYATWQAGSSPQNAALDCVGGVSNEIHLNPRLSAAPDGQFALVYQGSGSSIYSNSYAEGLWGSSKQVGEGLYPEILVDDQGREHITWCSPNRGIYYSRLSLEINISPLPCLNRPALAVDSLDQVHVVWDSDMVVDTTQHERSEPVLYESILKGEAWSSPMIVSRLGGGIKPVMAGDPQGVLHLVWNDKSSQAPGLHYSSQIQYDCPVPDMSPPVMALYNLARSEDYRQEDSVLPYCQNRYERLHFTPAPKPEFSDEEALEYGGFEDFNQMMLEAQYEVLLATMEFDQDENKDSPAYVLAQGITALYEKVKENPENYPRGMTVRFVLGNPPRGEINSDLWRVMDSLKKAGLPEMVNEEIGWRLEVGNFEGAFPHSHVKVLVIDGKRAVSAGFNYQYHHLPADHPSGKGLGTFDMGIDVTGPIAQDVMFTFDELWEGATLRYCPDLSGGNLLWQYRCQDSRGVAEHVPEVMRYFVSDGQTVVFSMPRTKEMLLSDAQVEAVFANAEKKIDVIQSMFSMPLVCDLNYLYNLCNAEQGLPYIKGIIAAADNRVQVRLLLKMSPFMGTEAVVSLEVIQQALAEQGLEGVVEVRPFPATLHAKTAMIDDEIVIIGSQNYHYSAFGDGLAEHNLAVVDPQAVSDYQRVFEYYWQLAEEQ